MNYAVLVPELRDDPLSRGYSGMTDAEVAAALNVVDRTRKRDTMTSAQIYEAIVTADFQALSDGAKVYVRDILGLWGDIAVGSGSKARAVLIAVFGIGSATIAALAAALNESISRASELGLPRPSSGHIKSAREIING